MALPTLPPHFVNLQTAFCQASQAYNVIGVCTDFLPAVKSGGTDYTIKFNLQDPSWNDGVGMPFRFFHKDIIRLPRIENQGDILILRSLKTTEKRNEKFAWSNAATSWIVLEHSSVAEIKSSALNNVRWHSSNTSLRPSSVEIQYARDIYRLQDSAYWPRVAPPTQLQVASIIQSQGGTAPVRQDKFQWIKNLKPPKDEKYLFVELLGEVRKIYNNDFRVEISVTDFTENQYLFKYDYGDNEDGYDGDQYGYVQNDTKKWPGPWGKMTMIVNLWPPHDAYAREHVRVGSFVYLRNVQIKLDRNGDKLEGNCRGDRQNPTKILVSVLKPREAEGSERFKDLLRRKRDYEAKEKAEHPRSVQQLDNKRKTGANEDESTHVSKSKKKRDRRRGKAQTEQHPNALKSSNSIEPVARDAVSAQNQLNAHVQTNKIDVRLTTIVDILDPGILRRTTAKGNDFTLPFQNCCYKSKVRVIDYFPDNIADFCAPVKSSIYEVLPEHDSGEEEISIHVEDIEMNDAGIANGTPGNLQSSPDIGNEENSISWKWRFILLIEDAHASSQTKDLEPCRLQMELLVADTDGDYLLRDNACNLRDPRNARRLAMIKEKLFVLWGDLAERKEEVVSSLAVPQAGTSVRAATDAPNANGETIRAKPKARPFECFIKEYGVPIRKEDTKESKLQNGSCQSTHVAQEYERTFQLCHTTII